MEKTNIFYPNCMKTLIGLASVFSELGRHTGDRWDWGFGWDQTNANRVE